MPYCNDEFHDMINLMKILLKIFSYLFLFFAIFASVIFLDWSLSYSKNSGWEGLGYFVGTSVVIISFILAFVFDKVSKTKALPRPRARAAKKSSLLQ